MRHPLSYKINSVCAYIYFNVWGATIKNGLILEIKKEINLLRSQNTDFILY